MNYDEAIDWLYRAQWFGIKLGLSETRQLLDRLGNPQNRYPTIHVAGTNGKGSVCAFAAEILRRRFSKVGLFTSPHLIDFRERMTLNGQWADAEHLADILTRIRKIAEKENAEFTFFKITTALAFTLFAEKSVDVAVIETGMGGAQDCTNILTPQACGITTISLDHTQWLGPDIASIAREKAGIIKAKTPVFTTVKNPVALEIIKECTASVAAPFTQISELYRGATPGLAGTHQRWNAALAAALCRSIEPDEKKLSDEVISQAITETSWPGRFQKISLAPGGNELILDGAHNPEAIREVVNTWKSRFGEQRTAIIFGSLTDKNWNQNLRLLSEIATHFYFVPLRSPRSMEPSELVDKLKMINNIPGTSTTSEKALAHARQSPESCLLTGSLFLVGEALSLLKKMPLPPDSEQ
ncbi:MAG: bifunctional folylpolyglutamate synthase/dihydrofolate synthase [Chthoniobacterales bacterium]